MEAVNCCLLLKHSSHIIEFSGPLGVMDSYIVKNVKIEFLLNLPGVVRDLAFFIIPPP